MTTPTPGQPTEPGPEQQHGHPYGDIPVPRRVESVPYSRNNLGEITPPTYQPAPDDALVDRYVRVNPDDGGQPHAPAYTKQGPEPFGA